MGKYKECIENLINGNLKDAKRQAIGLSVTKLQQKLREEYGFSRTKAMKAVIYLTTPSEETFQNYCDEK